MIADAGPWRREWRFLQLTLFLGGWMLVAPHAQDRWLVQALIQVVLADSVAVAMWANPRRHGIRRFMVGLWLVSLAGSAFALMPLDPQWHQLARTVECASRIPLIALLAEGILRYVFHCERLSTDGIFATIAVYLLIAFLFAQFYLLLLAWNPGSFNVGGDALLHAQKLQGTMVYFSLVTLATLGYGDVLPLSETARSLAVIEAVVGQFYVGVIVAVFVGMYANQRKA